MSFKLGRRAALFVVVALIGGLMAAQPTVAAVEWQNPARHLTVTDPDGGSLGPGDSVQAALSGFAPETAVQLAVCYDSAFFMGPQAPSDFSCTPRTPVVVDQAGSATVSYQIPAVGLRGSLAGNCSIGMFGGFSPCSLVAFEGSPLVSVASAAMNFAQAGTASVSGRVVDDVTGTPLTASGSVELCLAGSYDCVRATASSGNFQFSSLPAGTYSVKASDAAGAGLSFGGDMGEAQGSNTVGVVVADGQAVTAVDVPVPSLDATTGPVGYGGATMSVTPANPAWNDDLTISAGGFRPGHEVNLGLCSPLYIMIQAGHLVTCPRTVVTADQSGNATLTIPYTADRFQANCGIPDTCFAFAHETDLDGRGRWEILNFSQPTGTATISGNVTLGGAPLTSSSFLSVRACGPVGCTFPRPNGSAFTVPAPADGDYSITANAFVGGRSLSTSTTVTVTGQQSVTGIDLELDTGSLPAGSISGIVKDSTGDLVPGVTVAACKVDGAACTGNASATADGQGQYRLPYLGDGTWRLSVTSPDFTINPAFTQLANVSGGAATTGIDLTLPVDIGTGSIQVAFVDVHGQPINASASTCYLAGSQSSCRSVWSPNTTATLKYLPDGTYSVLASAGGTSAIASVTVTGGGMTQVTMTLPLAPGGGSIAGTVRDAERVPVAFTSVNFCAVQSGGECSPLYVSTTQADGTFLRPDLPDGTYRVTAYGLDLSQSATTTVVLSGGAHLTGVELIFPSADHTPPTATATVTPEPNADGWINSIATITLEAADEDGGSGLANVSLGYLSGMESPLSLDVATDGESTFSYSATDRAWNWQQGTVTVKVDQTAPTVYIAGPDDATTVPQGAVVAASYSCDDATSGIASCIGSVPDGSPIDTSTPGTTTLSVTATDLAGNTTTETRTVTVTAVTPPVSGDRVSVTFSGSIAAGYDADLVGQAVIKKVNGQVTSATASGTVPGAAGGTATVDIAVTRLFNTPLFVGWITVTDPGRGLSATAPIFGKVTTSDSTVSGTARWFTSRRSAYTVNWSITDGG